MNRKVYLVTDTIEVREEYGFGLTVVLIGTFRSLRGAKQAVKNRMSLKKAVIKTMSAERIANPKEIASFSINKFTAYF